MLNKKTCKDCGKKVKDSRILRCRKCADKQHSIRMLGQNNPAYKHGKTIQNQCKDCKSKISSSALRCTKCYHLYIKFSGLLKGRKITWAKKIANTIIKKKISVGKNNPMFGKVTHPKYIQYKNIWFHSSWEVKYAKYLNKNNIKWLYEQKTFDLGNTTYTPDFYLPETNEYIEIKGYWRIDALKKFRKFKRQYSQIKIKVLNEKLLKIMEVI